MTPPRSPKVLLGSLLAISLPAGAAICSGCGSDGAGTIHIDSPKARRQVMQTGAGVTPTATAKPSPSGMPRKSVPRSATKNHVPQSR
jgi:hypothetical protein